MKKILKKACKAAASAALTATKVTVNSTCVFYMQIDLQYKCNSRKK